MRALGRIQPRDYAHVISHPFDAAAPAISKPTPVVAGTEWLEDFDSPVLGSDGKWRISTTKKRSRGGHCYCFEFIGEPDSPVSWRFYNQQELPACEGFGNSRALTLLHSQPASPLLLDAVWLYDDARRKEGAYPDGEGSTNKAAAEALKSWGDHPAVDVWGTVPEQIPTTEGTWRKGVPSVGISSYHWATSVEQIRQALGFPSSAGEFPILNSWGDDANNGYPHRVYVADSVIDWLLVRGAEYTVLVP